MRDRRNKSSAYLAWKIALEALLKPELGPLIEPSGAVLNSPLLREGVFIGCSSLRSVNSSLLEWRAKKVVIASKKESESTRATIINWSSSSLFSRLIIDALDRRRVNRRSEDSKSALQVSLSLIKAAWSSSFFTKEKRALTRALASTSFGHCNG